jgi:hypothetical protein
MTCTGHGTAVTDRYVGYRITTWDFPLSRPKPAPLELEFRRAVTVGLAAVPRVPGPKTTMKQNPGRELGNTWCPPAQWASPYGR